MITYFVLKVLDAGSLKVIGNAMVISPDSRSAYYVGYGSDKDAIDVDYVSNSEYTVHADGYKDQVFHSDEIVSEAQTFTILLKKKNSILDLVGLGLIGFWLFKKIKI